MQTVLNSLLEMSQRCQREVNNLLVSPQTVTLRVLIESMQAYIIAEKRKLEAEENAADLKLSTPATIEEAGDILENQELNGGENEA